jgi:hypothetical protein
VLLDNRIIFWSYYCLGWDQRGVHMKAIGQIVAGAAMVASLSIVALPAFSQTTDLANRHRGAPGPIAGAGLPFLAVGSGVYWLVKRRRRKAE